VSAVGPGRRRERPRGRDRLFGMPRADQPDRRQGGIRALPPRVISRPPGRRLWAIAGAGYPHRAGPELGAKRLQLLKEVFPGLSRCECYEVVSRTFDQFLEDKQVMR
jgi:hypothetical protein